VLASRQGVPEAATSTRSLLPNLPLPRSLRPILSRRNARWEELGGGFWAHSVKAQGFDQADEWVDDNCNADCFMKRMGSSPEWGMVDQADVQQLANRGVLIEGVAYYDGTNGHLATVFPTPPDLSSSQFPGDGPFIRDGNEHPPESETGSWHSGRHEVVFPGDRARELDPHAFDPFNSAPQAGAAICRKQQRMPETSILLAACAVLVTVGVILRLILDDVGRDRSVCLYCAARAHHAEDPHLPSLPSRTRETLSVNVPMQNRRTTKATVLLEAPDIAVLGCPMRHQPTDIYS